MDESLWLLGGFFGMLVAIVIYLIPGIIAIVRKHKHMPAIMLTNVIFGWTVLGWFVALIWAFTEAQSKPTIIQYYQ
jgi:hypothetical protein